MHNDKNRCRVCGCLLDEPPWGDDGATPSFEICPCCGVEFGYEDFTLEGARKHRENWLAMGSPWFDAAMRPDDWNLDVQLRSIPAQYR